MKKIKIEKSIKIPGTNVILEEGDFIYHLNEGEKLEEAFAAGTAVNVARKMCAILGRRLGCKMDICAIPSQVSTSDGTYAVYYGYCKGSINRRFSIDFFLGKSDEVAAFCFYDNENNPSFPTEKIDLNGFNIVQVLDQIVDVFTGAFEQYMNESVSFRGDSQKLTERLTLTDMCASFLGKNPNYVQDINKGNFDYTAHVAEFIDFIQSEFHSSKTALTVGAFQWNIKNALQSNANLKGNAKVVPAVTLKTGVSVQSTTPLLSKADEKLWDEILHLPAEEKWAQYESYVRMIAQGAKNAISLIAYGTPGTGKTYNCERILKEEGCPYVKIGAPIADTSTIIAQVYLHKDNEVILFDDIDAIFSSGNRNDMFKQLLDQKPKRRTGTKKTMKFKDGMNTIEIPPEFDVTSRMIVLSNKPAEYFDSAILSRCFSCELLFSKEEMLDLIRAKMNVLGKDYPSLTMDDKEHVFDLLKRFEPKLAQLDLRVYGKALQGYWLAREYDNASGTTLDKKVLLFIGAARK